MIATVLLLYLVGIAWSSELSISSRVGNIVEDVDSDSVCCLIDDHLLLYNLVDLWTVYLMTTLLC